MCTRPITIHTKNMNGTPYIKRNQYKVPCGQCEECKARKQKDYEIRAIKEYTTTKNAQIFITLTYNKEHLPKTKLLEIPQFSKEDITKYTKRLRENIYNLIAERENKDKKEIREKEKIKFLITSEYGERRKRPHYHAIISIPNKKYIMEMIDIIQKAWDKGFTKLGKNFGIINSTNGIKYVTKYITKSSGEEKHLRQIDELYKEEINKENNLKRKKELQKEWENYQGKFFHISNEYGEYMPNETEWENNAIYVGEKKYTIPIYYKYKYLYENVKLDENTWQRQIKEKGIEIFSKSYDNIIKQHIPILRRVKGYETLTEEEKEYIIIGRHHKITKYEKKIENKRDLFNQNMTNETTIKEIEIFDKLISSKENKVTNENIDEYYGEYIQIRNNHLRKLKTKKTDKIIKEYEILLHEFNKQQKQELKKHEKAEVEQRKLYEQWNEK